MQSIYKVVLDIIHQQRNHQDKVNHLGQVETMKDDLNSLMHSLIIFIILDPAQQLGRP